jgi:outer membrane biosynthesis protein TonB
MNKYLKQSIALHVAVFVAMLIDMPNFWHHDMTLGEAPIIVDLSQVKIDEFTNLPTKAEFGPEDRKATVEEHKEEQYTQNTEPEPQPEVKEEPQPAEPEEEPKEEIKEDYVEEPTPVPDKKPEKKPDPKPTPKRPPTPSSKPKPKPKPQPTPDNTDKNKKQQEEAKVRSNALKSLMQEIDNDKNIDIGEKTQKAMIKEGTQVQNMGIEGGNSKGSYFSDLTISETDAIASLLRQNWNLDPGAIGIDGMMVEIRVHLTRDGTIQKIEFVDQSRFNSDPSYRSVAESAQRAVIATQQAFKEVFGQKYADRYDVWNTLLLKFDPLNKGVR